VREKKDIEFRSQEPEDRIKQYQVKKEKKNQRIRKKKIKTILLVNCLISELVYR